MTTLTPTKTTFHDDFSWRYATKVFDPERKVSAEDVEVLLEALRFSPSSFGLQPWKFLVVTNEALREQLRAHSWNQSQVTDCSHLLVLCAKKVVDEEYISHFVDRIAKTRGVAREQLESYEQMMLAWRNGRSDTDVLQWSKHQVYIALGVLLDLCAHMHIDSCPMEGFEPAKYDEILGLNDYTTTVLLPIGYRSADDHYAKLPKVRFDREHVIEWRK